MIKYVSLEPLDKTNPVANEILFKFQDNGVVNAQYEYLKEQLDHYEGFINSKYKIRYDTIYDDDNEILVIGVIIIIPDQRLPKDQAKLIESHKNGFPIFYEHTMELFRQ
jgi:hypothetical protein